MIANHPDNYAYPIPRKCRRRPITISGSNVWIFHVLFLFYVVQIRRDCHGKKKKMGKIIFSSRMTRWWLTLLPTNTWNTVGKKKKKLCVSPERVDSSFSFPCFFPIFRNPRRRHVRYKIGNDTKDTRWRKGGYLGRWTPSSKSAAHRRVFAVCRVYSSAFRSKYQWRKNVFLFNLLDRVIDCFFLSLLQYDGSLERLIKESALLKSSYGHYFDLTIVNNDIEETIRVLEQTMETLPSSAQWIPVSWIY